MFYLQEKKNTVKKTYPRPDHQGLEYPHVLEVMETQQRGGVLMEGQEEWRADGVRGGPETTPSPKGWYVTESPFIG